MNINIYQEIERLLQYGLYKKLITEWDIDVIRNRILEVLELDDYIKVEVKNEEQHSPVSILANILDWAAENQLLIENTVTYRDLLDTKIMGCFASLPSELNKSFNLRYEKEGPEKATQSFYDYSKDIHYIRTDRIAKNEHWLAETKYGDLEITVNLSKPEKDPIAIAAAKKLKQQNSYPNCLLCKENVGYAGRVNHPARQNLRTIPVTLCNEQWFFQFSPYVYYNEHAIVFSKDHVPMKMTKETFLRILQFVETFPHYFLGSNADLPIVGGSILTHEHYQGGYHDFPMAKAEIEKEFILENYPNVRAGIVKWPMSVIRLQSKNMNDLVELSDTILQKWIEYSDPEAEIIAFTEGTQHNTITPIARMRNGLYEMDLVLRNNRTSPEHPMGIFHPHSEVHHIKKENIGLIEVMGLAVLPGRLKEEMALLVDCLVLDEYVDEIQKHSSIVKHLEWAINLKNKYPDMTKEKAINILQEEIGMIFETILEHAGVFKRNNEGQGAFWRFIEKLQYETVLG